MPDTTVVVKKDGTGDYTSLSSAVNAANVSGGWYKIEIQDNGDYAESLNFSGATGTESATNYTWLTVAEDYRHTAGPIADYSVSVPTNARWTVTALSTIADNYTLIEWLDINVSFDTVNRAIDVTGTHFVLSHCYMWGDEPYANTAGGIWWQSSSTTDRQGYIDNCQIGYISNAYVVGVANSSSGGTHTLRIDHSTFTNYFLAGLDGSNVNIDIIMNNCFQSINTSWPLRFIAVFDDLGNGVCDLSGSYTGISYSSVPFDGPSPFKEVFSGTNWIADADITSSPTSTYNGWIRTATSPSLTNETRYAQDMRPKRYTAGAFTGDNKFFNSNTPNLVGLEPTTRQDYSVDLRGCKRLSQTGNDIGAFQVSDTIDQSRFRWRNDDGSETSATWAAAENTNITEDVGVTKRLRVQLDVDSGYPDDTEPYTLQFRTGAGAWRDVPLT